MSSPTTRRVLPLSELAALAARVELEAVEPRDVERRVAEAAKAAITEVVRPGEGAAGVGVETKITKVQEMMTLFKAKKIQKKNTDELEQRIIASFRDLPSENRILLLLEIWNSWPVEVGGEDDAHGALFDLIIKKAIPTKDFIEQLDLIKDEDDLIRACLMQDHFFKEETKWVTYCQSKEIGTGFMVGSSSQKQFVREKIKFIRKLLKLNKHKLLLAEWRENPMIGMVSGMFNPRQIILQVLLEIDTKQRLKEDRFYGLDEDTKGKLLQYFNTDMAVARVPQGNCYYHWGGRDPRNGTSNYQNISQLLIALRQIGVPTKVLIELCMHFIPEDAIKQYNHFIDIQVIVGQTKGLEGMIKLILERVQGAVNELKNANTNIFKQSPYTLGSPKSTNFEKIKKLRKTKPTTIGEFGALVEQVESLERPWLAVQKEVKRRKIEAAREAAGAGAGAAGGEREARRTGGGAE